MKPSLLCCASLALGLYTNGLGDMATKLGNGKQLREWFYELTTNYIATLYKLQFYWLFK